MKDMNWWHGAKGTLSTSSDHFQQIVDEAEKTGKYVVVDFFMPQCGYCEKFLNGWNQIVTDMTEEYGEDHI